MVAIPASELFQNQIKMRRRTISNFRQFLLALLLPAVAVATGLQSCNDEGPGIPIEENEPAKSSGNPLMRSPEEAIDIAQRAYEEFYGDATPSSRGRSVIDCSRPVEVVRCARSRGGSSDTLLYIVNFVDDQGFAVIAAPRAADELLAVTEAGVMDVEFECKEGSEPVVPIHLVTTSLPILRQPAEKWWQYAQGDLVLLPEPYISQRVMMVIQMIVSLFTVING